MTFEDIQREYDLTADDIRAALKFVAELANQESIRYRLSSRRALLTRREYAALGHLRAGEFTNNLS